MKIFPIVIGLFTSFSFKIADMAAGRTRVGIGISAARTAVRGVPRTTRKKMDQSKLAAPGVWGGDGIILNIDAKKARIEYACASGEISGRIRLDAGGNFKTSGFHKAAHGGPLRADDKAKRPAGAFSKAGYPERR